MNAFQKADREELDEQRGLLGVTKRAVGRPRSSPKEDLRRKNRHARRKLVGDGLALAQAEFEAGDLAPTEAPPQAPEWGEREWRTLDALKYAILARQRAWTIRSRRQG